MRDEVGDRFCGFHDLVSDERSDFLFARCQAWWLPELSEKMGALRYTPEAVKIFEHFGETQDVYYLRRNIERFMTMKPVTRRQYLRGRGKKRPFWKVYRKKVGTTTWNPTLTVEVNTEAGTAVAGVDVRQKTTGAGAKVGQDGGSLMTMVLMVNRVRMVLTRVSLP